ncbi:MAG: twin-arginine translocation signal domain-containing protein [Actinomycetota bacterium]
MEQVSSGGVITTLRKLPATGDATVRRTPLTYLNSGVYKFMKVGRREFLKGSLALGATALIAPQAVFSQTVESRIDILINEPVGTVNPNLYSHFVEHLGAVVYDGIWVGEKSRIPNYNGIRKDLVDSLKKIKPGVIRYPGGCFADQYDWRDGIGPRDQRPTRVNFWADTGYKASDAYKKLDSVWHGRICQVLPARRRKTLYGSKSAESRCQGIYALA